MAKLTADNRAKLDSLFNKYAAGTQQVKQGVEGQETLDPLFTIIGEGKTAATGLSGDGDYVNQTAAEVSRPRNFNPMTLSPEVTYSPRYSAPIEAPDQAATYPGSGVESPEVQNAPISGQKKELLIEQTQGIIDRMAGEQGLPGGVPSFEYQTPAADSRAQLQQAIRSDMSDARSDEEMMAGIAEQEATLAEQLEKDITRRYRDVSNEQREVEKEHPLLSAVAGARGGMGGGRVESPAFTDQEYKDYLAASQLLGDAKKVREQAARNAEEGSTFVANVGYGLKDGVFDVSTWDMGMSDIIQATGLYAAAQAEEKGEALTPSQEKLLEAAAINMATLAYYSSNLGRGYKAGNVAAQSVPFMLEMIANPASGMGKGLAKSVAKYGLKKFTKGALKAGARVLGDVAGAATMTATTGALGTAADAVRRKTGDVRFGIDAQGNAEYAGTQGGEESWGAAIGKAGAAGTIERFSELTGAYFAPIGKTIGKGIRATSIGKGIKTLSLGQWGKAIADIERRAQWQGIMGEYAEEQIATGLNALTVGDSKLSDMTDADQQIDTFLGVSIMGGFFSGMKTIGYRTPAYNARRELRRSDQRAEKLLGDKWQPIRDVLDNGTIERKIEVLRQITQQPAPQEQKQAVYLYANKSGALEGIAEAEAKQQEEGAISPATSQLQSSYNDGQAISDGGDVEAQSATSSKMNIAMALFTPERIEQLSQVEDPEAYIAEHPEESEALGTYFKAKAQYDGMIDGARENIQATADDAAQAIMHDANPDGNIYTAKMTGADQEVHIVSGNIVVSQDGQIDLKKSSDRVVVRDAEGNAAMRDIREVSSVVSVEEAEPLAQATAERVYEEEATRWSDQIDPPSRVYQNSEVVTTTDGRRAEITGRKANGYFVDYGEGEYGFITRGQIVGESVPQTQPIPQVVETTPQAPAELPTAPAPASSPAPAIQASDIPQPRVSIQRNTPMREDGTPDYDRMDATAVAESVDANFGRDVAIEMLQEHIDDLRKQIDRNTLRQSKSQNLSFSQRAQFRNEINRLNGEAEKYGNALALLAPATPTAAPVIQPVQSAAAPVQSAPIIQQRIARPRRSAIPYAQRVSELGDPVSLEDYILRSIATGLRFTWKDRGVQRGLARELGFVGKESERRSRIGIISNEGTTVDRFAEELAEFWTGEGGVKFGDIDQLDIRSTVIDILLDVNSPGAAMRRLEGIHIDQESELAAYGEYMQEREQEQEALADDASEQLLSEITPDEIAALDELFGSGNEEINDETLSLPQNIDNGNERAAIQRRTDREGIRQEYGNGAVVPEGLRAAEPAGATRPGAGVERLAGGGAGVRMEDRRSDDNADDGIVGQGGTEERRAADATAIGAGAAERAAGNGATIQSIASESGLGSADSADTGGGNDSGTGIESRPRVERTDAREDEERRGIAAEYTPDERRVAEAASAEIDARIDDLRSQLAAKITRYNQKKQEVGRAYAQDNQASLFAPTTERVAEGSLFRVSRDFSRGNMDAILAPLRDEIDRIDAQIAIVEAGRNQAIDQAVAASRAQLRIDAQIADNDFTPIGAREFNRLIDRLKKTGLAKDVITDPARMRSALEGELGNNDATRFLSLWHGSPNYFDKFLFDRSGTNAGTTYGFGIYLSDNREFADTYVGDGGTLYKVDLHGNKTLDDLNLIDWDAPLTDKQREDIIGALENIKRDKSGYEELELDNRDIQLYIDSIKNNPDHTSGITYDDLSALFGREKKMASELLSRIGIDGIRVRQTYKENPGYSYVVFDENAIDIVERIRLMSTPTGEVYGFVTSDGTIYLDGSRMNANTPIHEFAHLWLSATRRDTFELWKEGRDIIRHSEYWTRVNNNPAYAHLSNERKADEALAMAIGDRGEAAVGRGGVLAFAELRSWLNRMWDWIRDKLGIRRGILIDTITLEEFIDLAVGKLLGGRRITDEVPIDDNKRFQFRENESDLDAEKSQIIERAQSDGTYLKAPNGVDTRLTPEQWVAVRTRAFKRWFGDWENDPAKASKVIDQNGEPKVVYHGSTHRFYEFRKNRGNIENHLGIAHYFTDSRFDADENYLWTGEDLNNRITRRSEQLEEEGIASQDAKDQAISELVGEDGGIIDVFLNLRNPLDLTPNGTTFDSFYTYNEELDEYEENSESILARLADALFELRNELEDADTSDRELFDHIYGSIGYGNGARAYDIDKAIRSFEPIAFMSIDGVNIYTNEFIRRIYETMGFDGIIMDASLEFGENRESGRAMNMDYNTIHYLAFDSNQIKSATDNVGTFDESQNDIRKRAHAPINYLNAPYGTPDNKFDEALPIVEFLSGGAEELRGRKEEMIDVLSEKLNTPIRVVREIDDDFSRRSKGWYDTRTGEVVVVLPNNLDEYEVQATVLHEVVGHKGMRELFGDRFDALLDDIYRRLPEETRQRIASRALHMSGDNFMDIRVATEEYLASLAEGDVTPGRFARIVAMVRAWLNDVLGIDLSITDKDIAWMLWRSKNRLSASSGALQTAEVVARGEEVRRELFGENADYRFRSVFGDDVWRDNAVQAAVSSYVKRNGVTPRLLGERYESFVRKAYEAFDVKTKVVLASTRVNAIESTKNYMATQNMEKLLGANGYRSFIRSVVSELPEEKQQQIVGKYMNREAELAKRAVQRSNSGLVNNKDKNEVFMARGKVFYNTNVRQLVGRAIQDEHIAVKDFVKLLEKNFDFKVDQSTDLYNALNQWSSIADAAVDRYTHDFADPLMKIISDIKEHTGMSIDEVIDYITYQSAIERHNSGIFTIPVDENASGDWNMALVEAGIDRMRAATAGTNLLSKLWKTIDKANLSTLDTLVDSGLLTAEQKRLIRGHDWKYYVPLMGWDLKANEVIDPLQEYDFGEPKRRSNSNRVFMPQAEGRDTKPYNPISNMVNFGMRSIISAKRNEAMQYAMRLTSKAQKAKGATATDPIFRISKIYYAKVLGEWVPISPEMAPDPETIARSKAARKQLDELERQREQAAREKRLDDVAQLEARIEELAPAEEVREVVNSTKFRGEIPSSVGATRERSVEVYVNGVRNVITFADPAIARSINGNRKELPKFIDKTWGTFTRWLSSAFTSLAPAFVLTNSMRDIQQAAVYHMLDADNSSVGSFIGNLPNTFGSIYRGVRHEGKPLTMEEMNGLDVTDKSDRGKLIELFGKKRVWDTLFDMFVENGGQTGFVFAKDLQTIEREIKHYVDLRTKTGKNALRRGKDNTELGMQRVVEWTRALSEVSENASRFATFLAALDSGKSVFDAVADAKNITVNFNRRGEWSRGLGQFYIFFNAAIQGAAQHLRVAKENRWRYAAYAVSMTIKGFLASMAADWAMSLIDGGDDEGKELFIPYYVRTSNLVIPFFTQKGYAKIPLPQGLRMWHAWGTLLYDASQGYMSAEDAAELMAQSIWEENMPVPAPKYASIWRPITPSILTPLLDAIEGQDVFGRPTRRKTFSDVTPLSELGLKNANKAIYLFCRELNRLGGGDESVGASVGKDGSKIFWKKMIFEWNPSQVEHTLEYYAGGTIFGGTIFWNMVNTLRSMYDEDVEFETRQLPILNRFVGEAYEKRPHEEYYDRLDRLRRLHESFNKYRKAGDQKAQDAEVIRGEMQYQFLHSFDRTTKKYLQELKSIDPQSKEYEQINEQMAEQMRIANDLYNRIDWESEDWQSQIDQVIEAHRAESETENE